MRYDGDRPLWRQRRWWQDGLAFALLLPLVVTVLGVGAGPFGSGGPLAGSLLGYLVEVAAALAGWGLIGWAAGLRREEP